jgi:hypothetical protein
MPRRRPIVLLVRRPEGWEKFGTYYSNEEAETDYRKRIEGRGITAWVWWGPRLVAEQMLRDPSFDPDSRYHARAWRPRA